jgi:hypothetical protein
VVLGSLVLAGIAFGGSTFLAQQSRPSAAVYKSATCGCCSKWVDHLRAGGFDARATDVPDIVEVKRAYGVPAALESCHTAVVGGYVIEGHVPADAVARLLKERPADIAGLAVPGMPIGSPGMEQPGFEQPYNVIAFHKDGRQSVYERR